MTMDKLPGVYFGETVTTAASNNTEERMIQFNVQTSTAIPAIDGKVTLFNDINSFISIAEGKGLTKTIEFMQAVLVEAGRTSFYVYSIKNDTSAGFTASVADTYHLKEIKEVIYFEETKSTTSNTIQAKMTALKTACEQGSVIGAFRKAIVIPYATELDAEQNAENATLEETCITTFTSLSSGAGSGRLILVVPDYEGAVVGQIVASGSSRDAGRNDLNTAVGTLKYNFTRAQMLTLQNLGVNFIRPQRIGGVYRYKINMGVTTSFKDNAADGTLLARNIADDVLSDVDDALQPFILDLDNEASITFVQTAVDGVIAGWVNRGYVLEDTELTVADAGDMRFGITGKIHTAKPLAIIDVTTTIE